MPQVVSRTLGSSTDKITSSSSKFALCKNPFLLAFHSGAASTYGFAICWQNVSEASRQLTLKTNPAMRIYGKWRFLTYHCLVFQFVTYSLCLASHFVPKLRRARDFMFTTLALPISVVVVGSFWSVWFIMGREYIQPAALEPFYPSWLNHITHTIIAPINIIELLCTRKQYSSDKKSLTTLVSYTLSYTSFLLYIRFQTGRFVYPFLNQMDAMSVGAFITSIVVSVIVVYKAGKAIHNFRHGARMVKNKLLGETDGNGSGGNKSKKKN